MANDSHPSATMASGMARDYEDGCSLDEIAAKCGIPYLAVKMKLARRYGLPRSYRWGTAENSAQVYCARDAIKRHRLTRVGVSHMSDEQLLGLKGIGPSTLMALRGWAERGGW